MTNWSEQLKIRIRESRESQAKHLVVKTLVSFLIRLKYHSTLQYQAIYSEFPICEGKVCDVYHENLKEKAVYAYEVQADCTSNYIEKINLIYSEFEKIKTSCGFKSVNWIVIDLDKVPDDLDSMITYLKEQIC